MGGNGGKPAGERGGLRRALRRAAGVAVVGGAVALLFGAAGAPASPNAVSGTVTAGGSPVAFATVSAKDAGGNYVGYTQTGPTGTFSLSLADGSYTIVASRSQSGFAYGEGTQAVTVSGAPVTGVNIALPAANVTGHVLTPTGGALSLGSGQSVDVQILDADGQYIPDGPDSTGTASDGYYALTLPAGSYTLSASPRGLAYGTGTQAVTVASGTQTQDVRLTQPNVSGTVTLPDGSPAANANLYFRPQGRGGSGTSTSTGSDGSFNVLLAAGTYDVQVSAPFGSGAFPPQADALTVGSDPVTGLAYRLQSANFSGVVMTPSRDALGHAQTPAPVEGATVTVHDADYGYYYTTEATGADGTFQAYLPSSGGPFTVQANAPGGSQYDDSALATLDSAPSSTLTLTLLARNLTGSVHLGTSSGAGAQTSVTIHSDDYSYYNTIETDSSGGFGAGLGPGTYVLTASGTSGYTDSVPVTITVQPDGSITPSSAVTLVLGTPQLTGTVVDADGHPVAYASVDVHNADRSDDATATTGSDGTFSVGGLTAGASGYTADFWPPWGHPELLHTSIQSITVPAAGAGAITLSNNADGKVHYTLASDTIHVTVESADHTPITSGAQVSAFEDSGGYANAQTATGGTYDLLVSDGSWNVMVQPSSSSAGWVFARQPERVEVDSSHGTHDFTVTLTVTSASSHVTGHVVDASGHALAANTAWVSVSTSSGIGNGGAIGSGGAFDVTVPAGSYQVYVFPFASSAGPPAPQSVTVADGATQDVGTMTLRNRDATITGKLAYASGTGIQDAEVFAYQPDGGDFANATTAADGTYALHVTSGSWEIGVWAQPDDPWLYQGNPVHVEVASGATSTGNDFTAVPVAGHVAGTVLDPSGNLASADAWVSATGTNGESGAPLQNGSFSVGATAGTYTVRVFLPPGSPYLSTETQTVTVGSDGSVSPASLTFHLAELNDTISGRLVDAAGAAVTPGSGTDVVVSASDQNGNYEQATVRSDGTYSLAVGQGTWHIAADVSDPTLAAIGWGDGSGGSASASATFSSANATQTRDVVVAAADQHLVGTVTTSAGSGVPFAWVSVDSPPSATTPVHIGGYADENGRFTIQVPAGTYLVAASADVPNEDEPQVRTVDVASGTQSVSPLTMAFRPQAVTITGHVASAPSGAQVSVTAWSDAGGYAETTADGSGDYTLHVAGDDVWHVDASALSGTQAYTTTSGGVAVTAGSGGSVAADELTLTAETVQAAQTVTFDATQPTVLRFGDVQLTVPAGTVDTTGQARITASPLPAPPDTAAAHPIGLGFSFQAFKSDGTQVKTRFPNSIRITFPYDPAQLAALGLTPDQLAPAYLDPATNTYRLADNVVVDTSAHTVSFSTDHFTDFVLETPSFAAPTVTGLSPAGGTAGSSLAITVTGTGFVSGAKVLVGSYTATGVTVVSPTTIRATVPATVPAGTYAITVANSSGKSGTRAGLLTLSSAAGATAAPAAPAAKPDLGVELTSFPSSVTVGDLLTYVVTVEDRNGATATGVVLRFTLPDGVTLVSTYADHGPGQCTGTRELACALDYLAGDGVATVRVVVRVDQAGVRAGSAVLTFDQGDAAGTSVSTSTSVSQPAAAPSASVGGATTVRTLRVGRDGAVATTVRIDRAATVQVRVLAGHPRRPVTLLRGSAVGPVKIGRARTAVGYAAPAAGGVKVRVLVQRRSLKGAAYLQVIVTGTGGGTSSLVRLR